MQAFKCTIEWSKDLHCSGVRAVGVDTQLYYTPLHARSIAVVCVQLVWTHSCTTHPCMLAPLHTMHTHSCAEACTHVCAHLQ